MDRRDRHGLPEYADGGYVNTVIEVPANGGTEIKYPVLFHNCIFANKKSYNGYAGATAAFCRQYYMGQNTTGAGTYPNDWTVEGHTKYIEDNIKYGEDGKLYTAKPDSCRCAATHSKTATQRLEHLSHNTDGWK